MTRDNIPVEEETFSPEMYEQVVLEYPEGWDMKDLYGEVCQLHPSGCFSMFTAVMGHTHFIDPDNLAHHGALVRHLKPKERYPLGKTYISPQQKREMAKKAKARLAKQR